MFKIKLPFLQKNKSNNKVTESNNLTVFSVESYGDDFVISVNIKNYEKRFGNIGTIFDVSPFNSPSYVKCWISSKWDIKSIAEATRFSSKQKAEIAIKDYLKKHNLIDKTLPRKVYNLEI